MKIKSQRDEINFIDLLETIGARALSPGMKLIFEKEKIEYPCNKYSEMAKILGTTPYLVTKAIKVYFAKTDAEKQKLQRPRGRPEENLENQREAYNYLTNQKTLDRTKTYSLTERIEQFNSSAVNKVKLHTLHKFYK